MITFQNILVQLPQWQFKGNTYSLVLADEKILEFKEKSFRNGATFQWQSETYRIASSGYWMPKLTVENSAKEEVLSAQTNFWRTSSDIQFAGGNMYRVVIKNNLLVNIVYQKQDGTEILHYRLDTKKWRPQVVYKLGDTKIPDYELLMLFILGVFTIKDIAKENVASTTVIISAGA
ncbi:MAG: hypothetical protein SH856_03445 [Flavobacteriales bacterium]|nr:hypothetical protein [Flavobacteriales bacterium]